MIVLSPKARLWPHVRATIAYSFFSWTSDTATGLIHLNEWVASSFRTWKTFACSGKLLTSFTFSEINSDIEVKINIIDKCHESLVRDFRSINSVSSENYSIWKTRSSSKAKSFYIYHTTLCKILSSSFYNGRIRHRLRVLVWRWVDKDSYFTAKVWTNNLTILVNMS